MLVHVCLRELRGLSGLTALYALIQDMGVCLEMG